MPGGAPPPYRTVVLEDESLRSLQGFTQIPNTVLKHTEISFGAKVAYGVLLSYAWTEDFCFPAQERLARDLNCSVRQVQRLLTELKEEGFITWKQQGLNRPNIYYLLPIKRWNKPTTNGNPDTTNPSSPDTTNGSVQETTNASPKEYSRKNIHKIVNEHRPVRDRSGKRPNGDISDDALRSAYGLDDQGVAQVHHLVEKQAEYLRHVGRNHANYVKRAAEAVRDGHANLLDQLLGEFRDLVRTKPVPVASRPAYFHKMFVRAQKDNQDQPRPDASGTHPEDEHPTTHRRSGLFRPPETPSPDSRSRLIDDAERRGFAIPDHIRTADLTTINEWWAQLGSRS